MVLIIVIKIDPQPYKAYNIKQEYIITYKKPVIITKYYIIKY